MPPKELAITIIASFITAEIPKPEFSKTAPKIHTIIKNKIPETAPQKNPFSPQIFAAANPPQKLPKARKNTVTGEISIAGTSPTVRAAAIKKISTEAEIIPTPVPIAELIINFFKKFCGIKKRSFRDIRLKDIL